MNDQTMDAVETAPFTITETVSPVRYQDADGNWHEGAAPEYEQSTEDKIAD